jgi:Fe-S-cluster-containing dehydrogenase component
MKRRTVLKGLAAAGLAAVPAALPATGRAREAKAPPADAVGLLYDSTRCIGCKACVVGCRNANGLPPSTATLGPEWDAPVDLDGATKNVILLARDGEKTAFMKRACMHCVDPACVSACMIGALQKREFGIVTYDVDRCIGCRYCQAACPFDVPKFEWATATPKIVKCELCHHRLAEGKLPGCVEACPREAVIFGKRDGLLADAKRRIAAEPKRYQPKVFGETDGGGTQVLILAGMPYEKLGLPVLGPDGVPHLAETVQHGIYQGFLAPAALYAALGIAIWRNRKREHDHGEPGHEHEEDGR